MAGQHRGAQHLSPEQEICRELCYQSRLEHTHGENSRGNCLKSCKITWIWKLLSLLLGNESKGHACVMVYEKKFSGYKAENTTAGMLLWRWVGGKWCQQCRVKEGMENLSWLLINSYQRMFWERATPEKLLMPCRNNAGQNWDGCYSLMCFFRKVWEWGEYKDWQASILLKAGRRIWCRAALICFGDAGRMAPISCALGVDAPRVRVSACKPQWSGLPLRKCCQCHR